MALAYVLDPCLQHQNQAGVNNTNGFFRVYRSGTDDIATTYSNFNGALNPENIPIDNNGRCVIIADDSCPYRVEMYLPNGGLVYTQDPIWPKVGSGAASTYSVQSTDGSIEVTRTSVGGNTDFDLSVAHDDGSEVDWVKCVGAQQSGTDYFPLKSAGTLDVGPRGPILDAGMYYHATMHIRATKGITPQGVYDRVSVVLGLYDGESVDTVCTSCHIVDYSLGLPQEFDVCADIKVPDGDRQLTVSITGQDIPAGSFELVSLEVHRVGSGMPPMLPVNAGPGIAISDNSDGVTISSDRPTYIISVIETDYAWQVNRTYADILAAWQAGQVPEMVITYGNRTTYCGLNMYDNGVFVFAATPRVDNGSMVIPRYSMSPDGFRDVTQTFG